MAVLSWECIRPALLAHYKGTTIRVSVKSEIPRRDGWKLWVSKDLELFYATASSNSCFRGKTICTTDRYADFKRLKYFRSIEIHIFFWFWPLLGPLILYQRLFCTMRSLNRKSNASWTRKKQEYLGVNHLYY